MKPTFLVTGGSGLIGSWVLRELLREQCRVIVFDIAEGRKLWAQLLGDSVSKQHFVKGDITDGRFSGATHGFVVGHIAPEAQEGGPIALLQNSDIVTIEAEHNRLSVNLDEAELERRKAAWKMPPYKANKGDVSLYQVCQFGFRRVCHGPMNR